MIRLSIKKPSKPTLVQEVLDRYPSKAVDMVEAINRTYGVGGLSRISHMMILYLLASQYDKSGCRIVEIGSNRGRSAAVMSLAAPLASIATIDWDISFTKEVETVCSGYSGYKNIIPVTGASWEYLDSFQDGSVDMVFVDGDHENVVQDYPWWAKVAPAGLMLFHDYSPGFPAVIKLVDEMAVDLGRPPDVLVVPDGGMAGFYKGGR